MKCLCLVVLLSCVAFAQIQGPGSGDNSKNESNNGNNDNVNNNNVNNNNLNNNNENNNNESNDKNEGSSDNKNDGSDNNNNNGDSNNNNNGYVNNINNGFFNTINNGNFNNINSGNINSIMNGPNIGNTNNVIGGNMGNINNLMGGNMGNLNMINGNMGNLNNIMNGYFNNNNNNNNGRRTMNNFNVGNPDFGNITRPCSTFDIDCIRRFFAQHAKCKITYGPVPEPLYREQIISYVPRVNLTITLRKAKLRGVSNGRIEEFFVNQDTDKVVIAIEFRGLTVSSNHTYFRIHRRSKEPIVVKDYSSVTYQSVIMTAIIPKIYNLQLDRTVVFSYVNDPNPPYMFGPRVTKSRDPEVQATYAAFLTNPRANVQEIMLTDAPYYPPTYIQYNICDFGLKIF